MLATASEYVGTFLVAVSTVWITDFVRAGRDRKNKLNDAHWEIITRKWDALGKALETCPKFEGITNDFVGGSHFLVSIESLCDWVELRVEPWIDNKSCRAIVSKRQDVQRWLDETKFAMSQNPQFFAPAPVTKINSLRSEALSEVKNSIAAINQTFAQFSKDSNL